MPDTDLSFNTAANTTIARSQLIAYVNVAKERAQESPEWAPLGIRVEDSSMEMDWQKESKKDILDSTYSNMKKPIVTQAFDPWPLSNGDKAQLYLWNLAVRLQDAQKLSNLDMLIVHKYAGTAKSAVFAERYSACAVEVTKLGGPGGGDVDMSSTVTYGGDRTVGTAAVSGGSVTFSPASEASLLSAEDQTAKDMPKV